jgi:hypothetical protein
MLPSVIEENVGAVENVLAPANVCVPVVTSPRAEALASGILNVCVVPTELIAKSVPVVPVENVCVAPESPPSEVIADVKYVLLS